jgi:hypothetical protein
LSVSPTVTDGDGARRWLLEIARPLSGINFFKQHKVLGWGQYLPRDTRNPLNTTAHNLD